MTTDPAARAAERAKWERIERRHATRSGETFKISRKPRLTRCSTCSVPLLRGLDAIALAIDVELDVRAPLSAYGEAAARVAGLGTWSVRVVAGSRWQIDDRDQWSIPGRPAGGVWAVRNGLDVYPHHRCGWAWADVPGATLASFLPATPSGITALPLEPPF